MGKLDDDAMVLPLASTEGLDRAQAAGRACVSCGKRFSATLVPLAVTPDGVVLRRCTDCEPVLEHAG